MRRNTATASGWSITANLSPAGPGRAEGRAADDSQTDPTMEQAFITLINRWDKENSHGQ